MNCKDCNFFDWCPTIDRWPVLMPRDNTKIDKEHCFHYLRGCKQIPYFDDGIYKNPCPILKEGEEK